MGGLRKLTPGWVMRQSRETQSQRSAWLWGPARKRRHYAPGRPTWVSYEQMLDATVRGGGRKAERAKEKGRAEVKNDIRLHGVECKQWW